MAAVLFQAPLGAAFQATQPVTLPLGRLTLDFELTVAAAATVEFYLEYTSESPYATTTLWRREVAEEAVGSGVVNMPLVVRTLQANGGGALGIGSHYISTQFERLHGFARAQIRVNAGTVTLARVLSAYGEIPNRA